MNVNQVYSSSPVAKPAVIPLPRQEIIHQFDSGLYSVQGAQAVISAITSQRVVKKLILGHNQLGDAGCIALFEFLSSDIGRRYEINEISLNSNHIGDSGLAAIGVYLHGNTSLRELILQNNAFTGDPITCRIFTDAVNASQLEVLSLTSNQDMSDAFIGIFLPALSSDYLRVLYLSTMNITSRSLPHFRDYLSSKRCKLNILQCNGNYLGFPAVLAIIHAVRQHNFSLASLGLHSNRLMDPGLIDDDAPGGEIPDWNLTDAWKDCIVAIKQITARNEQLGRETQQQALKLLRHARVALLRSEDHTLNVGGGSIPTSSPKNGERPGCAATPNSSTTFQFRELPLEIQHHILSFISPILSPGQCSNIYSYVATTTTLPPLLPHLSGSTTDWKESIRSSDTRAGHSGRLLGIQYAPVNREKEKHQWLAAVGCVVYEPSEPRNLCRTDGAPSQTL